MLTPIHCKSAKKNGYKSVRTGPLSNGRRWPGWMNRVSFQVTWMAKCMCMAYLGKAWHQGALWEEAEAGWWFGDLFHGEKWSCYSCEPTTALSFFIGYVHDLHERVFMLASFGRIMHRAHSKNGISNGFRPQQHIWSVYLAFNTPQITNLCVRQTPLFPGRILRDLEDLPTSWCQGSSCNITWWVRAVLAAKIKGRWIMFSLIPTGRSTALYLLWRQVQSQHSACIKGLVRQLCVNILALQIQHQIERNKCFTGTKEFYLFLKLLLCKW